MGLEMDEWKRKRADILVFPPVFRRAYLFSFLDLYPIIGEALYLSVESEFGTRGNIKVVTLELLQTPCQLMAVCFNVSASCRCSNLVLAGCRKVPLSLPGNQPRLSTESKGLLGNIRYAGEGRFLPLTRQNERLACFSVADRKTCGSDSE